MPNTYSQIYIHIVFAVKYRENLIAEEHRDELQKFITGIVTKREAKMIAIYCMPDHTHIFVGLNPMFSVSDLVRDVKAGSSKFINEKKWVREKFNWQTGFAAFSYSDSQIGTVANYIRSEKEHHARKSFSEEYRCLLQEFNVEYKEEYLFKDV